MTIQCQGFLDKAGTMNLVVFFGSVSATITIDDYNIRSVGTLC